MRKSAVISIALHLAILLWVLVVFPSGRALDAPIIADVPIDIVSPSEFTKIKAGMVDAKDDAPLAAAPEAVHDAREPLRADVRLAVDRGDDVATRLESVFGEDPRALARDRRLDRSR